jgi:hypothetical protein
MVSGTIKRQKWHFVRVESTTNFLERESQKHMILRLPLFLFLILRSVFLTRTKLWVSGTIKRQNGHFVHVESTRDFVESESQRGFGCQAPIKDKLDDLSIWKAQYQYERVSPKILCFLRLTLDLFAFHLYKDNENFGCQAPSKDKRVFCTGGKYNDFLFITLGHGVRHQQKTNRKFCTCRKYNELYRDDLFLTGTWSL